MKNDVYKYWTKFVTGAAVHAGIFVAYRLYVHYLNKEKNSKTEENDSEKSQSKKKRKNNAPKVDTYFMNTETNTNNSKPKRGRKKKESE